jgi:hypothetical protein
MVIVAADVATPAPAVPVVVTEIPAGTVFKVTPLRVRNVIAIVFPDAGVPASRVTVALAEPERATLVPPTVIVVPNAALAGTTDKSPNPSEATATADTFFNEIVFTIFLSLSQIKEFLLPGW